MIRVRTTRLERFLAICTLAFVLIIALPRTAAAQMTEADVYVAQAVLDYDEKRYDAALGNLRRALELEPDHLEALYFTGVVNLALNRPAEAVPFLERARARARTDPAIAYQLGLAYFAQQQYDRAEPVLEELFRQDPTLDGLGYYVGFMRYRKKDYQGALRAFRSGRTVDPELQQLTRFYGGLALGVLGLPGQAAAEIDQALRLVPGSALTGPAERLRDTILAARQQQRRFSAELRIGAFYDDNVTVVPDRHDSEPLVRLLRRQDHDSFGQLFGARGEYAWLQTDRWEGTAGLSFFATVNNDLPAFDIINLLGSIGLTHKTVLGGLPTQIGSQYAFDVLFLGGDEFIHRHTVSLFGTVIESSRHLTQVFARYQKKQFNEDDKRTPRDEFRDADNWLIGMTHFLRFAEDRHFLKLGYQFDYDDTDGRNYEYRGHRLLAGGQYTLPWKGIRLRYDVDVHFRDYVNKNSLLPSTRPGTKRRADQELTNIVRAEFPLPYNLTLAGEYQSTLNMSNLAVFDYTRNVFSLILSWSY